MASRKDNLKALFTNTRSRVIIVFTFLVLFLALFIGIVKLISLNNKTKLSSGVPNAPAIQSIPGGIDPTVQYAKLQEAQNVSQAKTALEKGGSAIPTIIRSQAIGTGVGVIGASSGVGFSALAREDAMGKQHKEWMNALRNNQCSRDSIEQIRKAGASLQDVKEVCTCAQLKLSGYTIKDIQSICTCDELKSAGFKFMDFKRADWTASQLKQCDFTACELRTGGFSAQQLKDAGLSDDELKGAGYLPSDILRAGGIPDGVTIDDIRNAGCSVSSLAMLREKGVSAAAIRRISGCPASALKGAGYTENELQAAGFSSNEIQPASTQPTDCSVASLTAARMAGQTATSLRQKLGCSAAALKAAGFSAKDLKDAGFTAAELKKAGFSAGDLKAAGFSAKQLKDAGFSAKDLKDAGFSAGDLKAAGFSAKDLKDAGFSPKELKDAGFSAKELKDAGFSAADLKAAGFSAKDLKDAGFTAADLKAAGFSPADLINAGYTADQVRVGGFSPNELAAIGIGTTAVPGLTVPGQQGGMSTIPGMPGYPGAVSNNTNAADAQKLQEIMRRQDLQLQDQKYQQKIQQRTAQMTSGANQVLQTWKKVANQVYTAGTPDKDKSNNNSTSTVTSISSTTTSQATGMAAGIGSQQKALIKTGDILFGVIDTAVNTDEPSPILATIISGRFKGAKLIGSFTLPPNSEKMVITFNKLSVPGAARTTSISAYAIDAETARTALSSNTNTHFLYRYGNLFASSFLSGLGDAYQSADTSVTIAGTGAGDSINVQNGINRSALQNAIIALGDVGKAWGQVAQQNFNRPTTVQVYSGTGIGVLFTQDLMSL